MPTKISAEMNYQASCGDIFAMYTDQAYILKKLAGTGGTDPTVEVSEAGSDTVVNAGRTLPSQIPAFAKAFVGDTVRVDERQQWSPADDKGARSAIVTLVFQGAPVTAHGKLFLEPAADGCVCRVEIEAKSSVPLIGGKIEGVIVHQLERAIRQENKIGNAWLAHEPS